MPDSIELCPISATRASGKAWPTIATRT